ncbi:MAG: hypothetical protein ACP5MG_13800 [Verrucomicrobiia bacterium]
MKYILLSGFLTFIALVIWRIELFKIIWNRLIERILLFIGKSQTRAVVVIFALSFILNASIALIIGESPPHIHDEFANLLAADTFARGRLSNPPHKYWEFFEAIHTLSYPAYVSKYPPAQGMMFAIGQMVFNKPIVGSWLAGALASGAICWALFGWMRAKWAVFGGLLAMFHPVILKWSQVYWGGSEAMFGGALVFGATGRLLKEVEIKTAIVLACGMVVLALSRPFEGFILTAICAGMIGYHFIKIGCLFNSQTIARLYIPSGLVLLIYFCWQGYYNWRITGSPTKMPYMVYEEQYAVAPFLLIQKPRPIPNYNHEFIKKHFVEYAFEEYKRQQTLRGFLKETATKYKRLAKGYLWNWALVIPFFTLPFMFRRRGTALFPLAGFLIFTVAIAIETWMWDRYAAPAGALFFCLVVEGFRRLKLWKCCNRPLGVAIVIAALALCAIQTALWLKTRKWEYSRRDWDWQRVQIIKKLESDGGKHLIFVRYGEHQSVHNDWVHNSADIDGQKVVWARDMGGDKNKNLIGYYKDRKVWLLEADNEYDPQPDKIKPAILKPYE